MVVAAADENDEGFSETDAAIVIRSNDIVNPAVQEGTSSPIAGMPVHCFGYWNTVSGRRQPVGASLWA